MKKVWPYAIGSITTLLFWSLCYYLFCPALNLRNAGLWAIIILGTFIFAAVTRLAMGFKDIYYYTYKNPKGSKKKKKYSKEYHFEIKPYILPIVLLSVFVLVVISGTTMFNATLYSEIITVRESDFSADLAESIGTDSIALMDTASAQMLGDREIGSLSHVVSQFNVSDDYTQIDLDGKPIKVSALEYA